MARRANNAAAGLANPAPKAAARRTGNSAARVKSESVPVTADLPATCGMLAAVRTELLERIDQAKIEVKTELKAEIQGVKRELTSQVNGLGARLDAVDARLGVLEAGQHELKAAMERVCFLVEEQNTRNMEWPAMESRWTPAAYLPRYSSPRRRSNSMPVPVSRTSARR